MTLTAPPQTWEPIGTARIPDTNALIVDLLGFNRDTFRASSFLVQGDDGFLGSKPTDRKKRLADLVVSPAWEQGLGAIRKRKADARRTVDGLTGRIDVLAERAVDVESLVWALADANDAEGIADNAEICARAAHAEASERVRSLERAAADWQADWQAARHALSAAQARLDAHEGLLAEAENARVEAQQVQQTLATLPEQFQIDALEAHELELVRLVEDYRLAETHHRIAKRDHDAAVAERDRLIGDAVTRQSQIEEIDAEIGRLLAADPETEPCPTCQRPLDDDSRDATISSLRAQIVTLDDELRALTEQADAITLPVVPPQPDPPTVANDLGGADPAATSLASTRERLRVLRGKVAERATLEERLRKCQDTAAKVDTFEYRNTLARRRADVTLAAQNLDQASEPDPAGLDEARAAVTTAQAAVTSASSRLQTAREQAARLTERLAQARADQDALAAARADREQAQTALDDLTVLEHCFGRDGVPRWIVEERVIPDLEDRMNDLLTRFGTGWRAELRTEGENLDGSESARPPLDVWILTADKGDGLYESFSEGEKSRIRMSFSLALAGLLRSLGGGSDMLFVDEIQFLDPVGQQALADLVLGMRDEYPLTLLVSHDHALQDAFPSSIVVRTEDGVARVEVAA